MCKQASKYSTTYYYNNKLRIVELSKKELINYEMKQVFLETSYTVSRTLVARVDCRCVVVNVLKVFFCLALSIQQ
jgi:hypothetical protein